MKHIDKSLHFLIFLLIILLSSCKQEETIEKEVLRPVRTLKVTPADVGNIRVFSAVSQSEQVAQLSFRVPGTVTQLSVKVGDVIKKGDIVARLDEATYALQAAQARASVAQARATESNASSVYQRTKGLYENNNASKNDLDASRASAESAKAQLLVAQQALQLAQLNVDYTKLIAQEDCAISQINVEVNENVNSGTPVVSVDCGSDLKVNTSVPESLIAKIQNGQKVSVRFSSIADKTYSGIIDEVGVSAIGSGSTFPVSITLDSQDNALRSGLAAEVVMEFSDANKTSNFYLPVSAVNKNNDGAFVYVANPLEEGKAKIERRKVTIGELTEQGIVIHSGLEVGDNVVIAGTKVIRPEMTVLLN